MTFERILKVCGVLALGAVPSFADIGYIGVPLAGDQAWGGNLGMDFTVNSAVTLDYMGVFNNNGGSTLASPLSVEIFNVGTGDAVAGTLVNFSAGTPYLQLDATDLFASIAPVTLSPGTTYSVVARGFTDSQFNGNGSYNFGYPFVGAQEGGSPYINYTGGSRYDDPFPGILDLPSGLDSGPSNRYDAGTFAFTPAPEPGFYGVLALGLTGLFTAVRRRKSA
jgi:hypothetical protein